MDMDNINLFLTSIGGAILATITYIQKYIMGTVKYSKKILFFLVFTNALCGSILSVGIYYTFLSFNIDIHPISLIVISSIMSSGGYTTIEMIRLKALEKIDKKIDKKL